MAKRREITVELYMILENGERVPFDSLTPEQLDRFRENAAKRGSAAMSAYFSRHPDEWIAFCEEMDRKEAARK